MSGQLVRAALFSVAMALIVSACAAGSGGSPSGDPSSESPEPSQNPIVELDVPLVVKVMADQVKVHTLPETGAPLLGGTHYSDDSAEPDITLVNGDEVFVTLGPIVADGETWYEASSTGGGDVHWENGWITADELAVAGEVSYNPVVAHVYRLGSDSSTTAEVGANGPLTVRFAAVPMRATACQITVQVTGTDGTTTWIAFESVDDPVVMQVTAAELADLYQGDAGIVTLDVTSDCGYAATISVPQG